MAPTSRGSSVTNPAQVREGSAALPWPIRSGGEVSKPTKASGWGAWVTRNHWLARAPWSSGRPTQRTWGTWVGAPVPKAMPWTPWPVRLW
jgi:hypothetical protein